MRDPAPEAGVGGVGFVEVNRVDVARRPGKGLDLLGGHAPCERGALPDKEFRAALHIRRFSL